MMATDPRVVRSGRRRLNVTETQEVIRLYQEEDKTYAELAQQFDVSIATIQNVFKRAGLASINKPTRWPTLQNYVDALILLDPSMEDRVEAELVTHVRRLIAEAAQLPIPTTRQLDA